MPIQRCSQLTSENSLSCSISQRSSAWISCACELAALGAIYAVGFPGSTPHDGEKFVWDGLGLAFLVVDLFFVDG